MNDATWLEVSVTVDGEMAEAVADVLSRYVPNGVVIETTHIDPDPEGEGNPSGPLRICGYIPVDERLEERRRQIEEGLWYLGSIRPLPAPQFKPMQEVNWVETWKEHYHPIPVGQNLIIVPAWLESPDQQRVPIRIDPGMAFGTGTHPTTQLCLEFIEEDLLRGRFAEREVSPEKSKGLDVIDVGCGSGILSIAALKLGANRALGVDIDGQALAPARANAIANGVAERLELGVGSVEEVRAGHFSISKASLVLANILAPVLVRLLDAGLSDLVAPGGLLVMSGILEEQWEGKEGHASLKDAVDRHHLKVIQYEQKGDWLAVSVSA